jgi:glycosyltransferase involved in cell wall biosynthesis
MSAFISKVSEINSKSTKYVFDSSREASPFYLMSRRIMLIRGGAMSKFSGLGKGYYDMLEVLQNDEVAGWRHSTTLEYGPTSEMSSVSRLRNRWYSHPNRVKKHLKNPAGSDIALITDQEQSHLLPFHSKIPIGIYVHDLFHIFPTVEDFPEGKVSIGQRQPNFIRKRDLKKLKKGLSRADFFFCNSEATQRFCQHYLPNTPAYVIAFPVNEQDYQFDETMNRYPSQFDESKCNLLVVGSNEPRKRLKFLVECLRKIESEILQDIVIHHVGSKICPETDFAIDEEAKNAGIQWLYHNGPIDESSLNCMRWNSEVLLFPSAAEGFGYPPLEAMMAGLPVLCSNVPAHNEFVPDEMCIDGKDVSLWVKHVKEVHQIWKQRDGPRQPLSLDSSIIERFSKNTYCATLSNALNEVLKNS